MKYFIYVFLFIVTMSMVISYDNSTLQNYWTMGDSSGKSVYDSHGSKNLTSPITLTSITGINGNALYGPSYTNGLPIYNTNVFNFGNSSWSFNFWIKSNGASNYPTLNFGYVNSNDYLLTLLYNSSGIRGVSATSPITITTLPTQIYGNLSSWNMITITYNVADSKGQVYINGIHMGNISAWNIDDGRNYLVLRVWENTLDEMSLFSQVLNNTDVLILYNNRTGLSYAQTLSGANASTIPEIPLDNSSGLYHNICYGGTGEPSYDGDGANAVCVNFNISDNLCMDSPQKICNTYCADTFDAYREAGLENDTVSFDAGCYPNASDYTLLYPTYEGYNASILLKDYCVGSYLCHYYNVTTGCEPLYNGVLNKIDCKIVTNNILATCHDFSQQYFDLNIYPPDYNFSGTCNECNTYNSCSTENQTRCRTDSTNKIEKCVKWGNCLSWVSVSTCANGFVCSGALCVLNSTTVGGDDTDDTDGLFGNMSTKTKYWLLLIICLLEIVFMTILVASFGDGLSGLLVGLIMSILTSLILTLVWELSLIIPILYILIGGSICAMLMRKIFYTG